MAKKAVSIKNLVKKFGDFTAVSNVTLDISEGEIFGLLGPNGAGKTTTINLILGLLQPASGKIEVNGLDVSKHPAEVKEIIGFMTQETVVETDLTARENLTLFAELYHVPKDEIPKRVERALKDSELVPFADKKAGTFSGGMRRRLELVKSMIQQPKILIFDEPTTGLDVQNRVSMWQRIRELRKGGVTIILTTQYLEEADALCDRIAIIDHGKIKATGTVSELKRIIGVGSVLEIVLEDEGDASSVALLLKKKFGLDAEARRDKVIAVISDQHKIVLTKILEELDKKKIVILSVNLHLPTLDDVFIKLTGSALRDSTGENMSRMSMLWMRR